MFFYKKKENIFSKRVYINEQHIDGPIHVLYLKLKHLAMYMRI